jgi:hypothetical protein
MVVIGLLIGLWAPLIAAGFCLSMLGRCESGYQAAILAATIATVATISIRMSYYPIAQSLGTILFVTLIVVLLKQIDVNRPAIGLIILILATAMAVSHKLPLLVATSVAGGIWLLTRVGVSDYVPQIKDRRQLPFWVVVALAVATILQQYVISSFLPDAVLLIENTAAAANLPQRAGAHPSAASVPDTGILQILFTHHSHAPVTLLQAGLSWLLAFWGLLLVSRQARSTVVAFLGAVASLVMLVIISIGGVVVPEAVNPFRIYALVELLLAGLIGIGVIIARNKTSYISGLMMTFLILTIVFNGFSASAAPDFPSEEREYLTPEEMAAKRFAVDYVPGPIYTDNRFVRQTPYPKRVKDKTNPWVRLGAPPSDIKFESNNLELVNGTAVSAGHPTLMYRTGESIYGTGDRFKNYRYRLEWRVENAADRQYHRAFDNGEVIIYRNSSG